MKKQIGSSKSSVPQTGTFQVAFYNGKLKEMNSNEWVEFITGVILELIILNLQTVPEPGVMDKMADRIYGLLKTRWPGVTQDQFYRTVHNGYTKQGNYGNFRVTYPLLANWLIYHREMTKPEPEKGADPVPLHQQAQELLAGLIEYRKRREAKNAKDTP